MERDAVIVAGFGCRAGATGEAFAAALAECAATPDVLAVPEDRAPLLADFAARLALPLVSIPPEWLQSVTTSTRSPVSVAMRGVGSVAEAAALAAAGPGARLIVTRRVSPCRTVTCAIANAIPRPRHCERSEAMTAVLMPERDTTPMLTPSRKPAA